MSSSKALAPILAVLFLAVFPAAAPTATAPAGNVVMLDFTASWCGPCQRMNPIVQQLESSGYPIRKVNYDTEKPLVEKYRVTGVPTFVLLVDGKEVDRTVGATSYEHLSSMFAKSRVKPGASPAASPLKETFAPNVADVDAAPALAQRSPIGNRPAANEAWQSDASARAAPPANAALESARDPLAQELIASTVRIRVEDTSGASNGSGTIIDTHEDEALVVTCGHLFRDSQGKAPLAIDTFGPGAAKNLPAKLLRYDLATDVALITFRSQSAASAARVAPKGHRIARGDSAWSVGCDHGHDAAAHRTRITSTRKFLGPDHLMAAGQPAQGRSGGGLFDAGGTLIGVCNAADPEDQEGMYAGLASVYAILDQANLAFVYGGDAAKAAPARETNIASDNSAIVPASHTRENAAPMATEAASTANSAEVVCVVRNLTDPNAKSEVVVLDRVSADFLAQLQRERQTQNSRAPTSLRTKNNDSDWQPTWRSAR